MKPLARSRESFDIDWRFHAGEARGAKHLDFDDRTWRKVRLPHDWSIEGPFSRDAPCGGSHGFAPHGIGWYRKRFRLGPSDRDRAIRLEFDGVYHNCAVWINGTAAAYRHYGYGSFHVEVPHYVIKEGDNVVAVRVDNSDVPNCRWYSGSGIYRHTWITRMSRIARIAHWGTSIVTPRITRNAATVQITTNIYRPRPTPGVLELKTVIRDRAQRIIATASTPVTQVESVTQSLRVLNPKLWSPDQPALYFAHAELIHDGVPIDDVVTPFGIRSIRLDSRRGFLLNGVPTKMKGVCLHHDAGCVGAAVPDRVLERRLEVLKALGCNAIRTSHNPPPPERRGLCDRMGFLVIDEAFDKWLGDFSKPDEWWMRQTDFALNWQADLRAMIQRDRNHPCVVMWSVGNETGQPGTSQVNPMLRKLVKFAREQDPTRPVTAALVNSNAKTLKQRVRRIMSSSKLMDVLSVNYQEPMYEHYRAADPNVVICGSETFKHYRGGAMNVHSFEPVNPWYDVAKHDYVIGQFLWPGIDYLGESNAWPLRGWPTGIIDACGFVKPEAWFHRCVWRPRDPVVRIAVVVGSDERASSWSAPSMREHWTWPGQEGRLLHVQTLTNCETVELLVNGKSFGHRAARDYPNAAIVWHVPYAPGTLRAIGRDANGKTVARHELTTAGPASRVELCADRKSISADGVDVVHVVARIVDQSGILVPGDGARLRFALSGPGRILGIDNGDLTDPEPYQSLHRTTRGGRCLAIVQSAGRQGRLTLSVDARGIKGGKINVSVA